MSWHNPKPRGLIVAICLVIAALACTSNDTLFIHLTETPLPSATPTILAVASRYHAGDTVTLISPSLNVQLPNRPGSHSALDMSKSQCFRNTRVKITAAAKSAVDPKDNTVYYNVECILAVGWVPEYRITLLALGQSVVVASADQQGAAIYEQQTVKSQVLATCPDGTSLTVNDLAADPLQTVANPDKNIYVEVKCSNVSGYILASALKPSQGQTTATPQDF